MSSKGTLVFNDQKLQAPEIYVTESLGVGVRVPTSNLEVVGNAYVSSNLEVVGRVMAGSSKIPVGVDRNDVVVYDQTPHDRPLVKYPEVLSATVADGTAFGGYTATRSSNPGGAQYHVASSAYDGNEVTTWATNYNYNTTTGAAGSSTTFEGENGDWNKLVMPTAIRLKHIYLKNTNNSAYSNGARDIKLYGSNDGSTWTLIKTATDLPLANSSDFTTVDINATQYFNQYVFQMTKIYINSAGAGYGRVGTLEYWGYEEGDVSTDLTLSSVYNKPGTEHLEVYWDANDTGSYGGSGTTVTDLSGNGRTGTISGTNGFDSTYNAWNFDGSGDYIRTSNAGNGTGEWVHSMSAWFKVINPGSGINSIMHLGTWSQYDESRIFIDDGKLRATIFGSTIETNDTIPENVWVHGTLVYSGGYFTTSNTLIYVNGDLMSTTQTEAAALPTLTGTTFTVGATSGNSEYFNGHISNARLFSKALSADQVKELYDWQKDHFLGSRSSMTLYKGNLGLGVAEPTARLEIAGDERIQEYPPRGMTAPSTYIEGHGVFTAYGTGTNYPGWQAFDHTHTLNTVWYSDSLGEYNNHDYTGSTRLAPETPKGAYLVLEMPYEIVLKQIKFWQQVNGSHVWDGGIYYAKCNPSDEWTAIHNVTDKPANDDTPYIAYITDSRPYKYFAIVITRRHATTLTSQGVSIRDLQFFGTPAPSTLDDGKLTLGKSLTVPRVSGHAAGAETPRAENLFVHYDTTVDSVVSGTTVVDTSGNGINATLDNGAVYSSSERAFTFNGTSHHMTGTLNNPSGAWVHTVSLWYKPLSVDNGVVWSIGGNAVNQQIAVNNVNGTIYYYIYGCNARPSPTTTFTTNKWHHVVAVFKNSETTATNGILTGRELYIDGVKQTLTAENTQVALNLGANTTFRLANQYNAEYNHGAISNFKIYDVALTAEEVAMEYALGRTGKSLNLTDTSLCLGGTVPRAQLDVRGTGMFDGGLVIKADNLEYARDGGITLSRAGLGTAGNKYSSQPIVLDGGDAGAVDANIRGGAIWSQWGGAQYGIAMKGASVSDTYPYLQTPTMFVTNDKVGIGTASPGAKLDVNGTMISTLNASTANYSFYDNIGSDNNWRTAFSVGTTAIGFISVLSYNASYSQANAIWYYQYKSGGTSGSVVRIAGSTSPTFRMTGQTVEHNGNGGTHFTQIRVLPFAI